MVGGRFSSSHHPGSDLSDAPLKLGIFQLCCLSFVFPEIPKTETNFEERLILKAFLLKFMNAYAPIFYVAFFKGR